MAKNHVGHGDAEHHTIGDHGAAGERLKRIDRAQMALAEKNAVIAELFGTFRAFVNFVDVFNAAVNAVQAKFHLAPRKGGYAW